ncbi:MAG: hypothetical protein ACI8U4_002461, partial [Natronomonas sp.]
TAMTIRALSVMDSLASAIIANSSVGFRVG